MAPKPAAKKPAAAKKTIAKKPAAAAKPAAKKEPSAYMKFCKATRPKIVKEKPSLSFGEVGKELGAAWAKLSDSEKAAFK
mmetsp:Transcript_41362/g.109151  ORF Transcript_41362/g.109151 Transcript_41362/m.109151 type:complete len:80 (+) Transcript_41362:1-240(+)